MIEIFIHFLLTASPESWNSRQFLIFSLLFKYLHDKRQKWHFFLLSFPQVFLAKHIVQRILFLVDDSQATVSLSDFRLS